MADLRTTYAGLSLKNPIIVGASELTSDLDSIKRMEDSGAAAVVVKSLFEEQIQLEAARINDQVHQIDNRYAEMTNFFPEIEEFGPDEHLMWVSKTKQAVDIPVVGSLNAVEEESWVSYAKRFQEAGVDAIELNLFANPDDNHRSAEETEAQQLNVVTKVKKVVSVPVTVKLSPYYTNLYSFIERLEKLGARGVVLFNRLYHPDINIESISNNFSFHLSQGGDIGLALRYSGILADAVKLDIAASGGVHSGSDIIKLLLAGANAVQIVSAIYRYGIDKIESLLSEIDEWMQRKEFATIEDFNGRMSKPKINDPWFYHRAQYIKHLLQDKPLEA